jgi:phosphoribosylamine-glycine ligase
MITKEGPKVIEFNARIRRSRMPADYDAAQSDLLPLLEATIDGKLDQ